MADIEKDLQEIKKNVKKVSKQIDDLDSRLSEHIIFVEKVYMPLQKSIDKFKKLFKQWLNILLMYKNFI